ncbi:MAG: FMN-binding protein [Clostridiales bacterium]|nr:FMN-binding protein [Clostridiales bacterium]
MKKNRTVFFGVLLCILIIVFLMIHFNFIKPINQTIIEVRNMKIEDVDLNNVKNGTYSGDYNYGAFYCAVEVTVLNHKISDIKIVKNEDTKYAKKAEGVILKVIEKQKVNVDTVSGATTTSKALLKATENALRKGLE